VVRGGEKMPLSLDRVKGLVAYSPEKGLFVWLQDRNSFGGKAKAGAAAGTAKDGYVQIIIEQRRFRAHRLAWWLMTGSFPPRGYEIDHINRDRSDNRWTNLRLVTRSQNNMKMSVRSDNKSGYRGVGRRKDTGQWYARIKAQGRLHLLGHFPTFSEAVAARKAAERRYFGEFAAA